MTTRELERPEGEEVPSTRDVRSVAHMKMLQSLGGKLNRLNDVREIGNVIATELRSLIDYHNCRVSVVEGDDVIPIAFVGQFTSRDAGAARDPRLQGRPGNHRPRRGDRRVAADRRRRQLRVRAQCFPAPTRIDESQVVVPLTLWDARRRRDRDLQARPQPVRRGRRAPARGARRPRRCRARERGLYEAARREAERATALLEFSRQLSSAEGIDAVVDRIVELSARTLGSPRASVWFQEAAGGEVRVAGDPRLHRARPRAPGAHALRPRAGGRRSSAHEGAVRRHATSSAKR